MNTYVLSIVHNHSCNRKAHHVRLLLVWNAWKWNNARIIVLSPIHKKNNSLHKQNKPLNLMCLKLSTFEDLTHSVCPINFLFN